MLALVAGFLLLSISAFAQKATDKYQGVSFAQYANKNLAWIPGILQSGKSEYYEGTSTLQRVVFVGIPTTTGNNHELTFKVLSTKGGINAYDFVTGYDQAFQDYFNITGKQIIANVAPGNPFDPANAADQLILVKTDAIPQPATATIIGDLFNGANKLTATAPAGSIYNSKGRTDVASAISFYDGATVNSKTYPGTSWASANSTIRRGVQLYGSAAITSAQLVFDGYTNVDPSTGDGYGLYTLKWTSASKNIMILMAGHLSIGKFSKYPALEYGANKGSSSISGGPYHFKLDMLDQTISLGNQDNQIASGSILPPPECNLSGSDPVCAGATVAHSTPAVTGTGVSYKWTLSGNGVLVSGGVDQSSPYTSPSNSISVRTTGAGSYTLTVEVTADGRTSSPCPTTVTVNANPTGTNTSQTLCSSSPGGSTAVFDLTSKNTAVGGSSTISVTWYTGFSGGVFSGPISAADAAAYVSGNATVYAKLSGTGGCIGSAQNALTVNTTPTATNTSQTLCSSTPGGTKAVFNLTSKNSAVGGTSDISVAWYTTYSGGAFSGLINTPSAFESGTATVYAKLSGEGGCVGVAENALTVNTTPAGTNVTMGSCPTTVGGSTAVFDLTSKNTAVGGSSTISVTWYTGFSGGVFSGPISAADAAAYVSGNATVYAKLSGTGGCIGSAQNALTVNASPGAPVATIDQPSCSRTLGGITVTSPLDGGGNDYEYSYDKGQSWTDEVIATFGAGQGYNIIYRIKGTGCISLANSCLSEEELNNPTVAPTSGSVQTKGASSQRSIRTEAFPNPTGRDATINFSVPKSGHVKVQVYNAMGSYVTTLFDGEAKGGESNAVLLKGSQLPSGTYYYKITADGKTKTNRISLVK